ncbi:MAG: nitroreductase family deazaflavin-dependent oxidoreductase [Pseudomonadales bacterium]|nr:nitroreductase family deazaflavin-dependent oxidoreductase [Pseudomonadales bacterium]
MCEAIKAALASDKTIDIVTTGKKSGMPRTTEIWFNRVEDRIIICGTPGSSEEGGSGYQPRHWLANLRARPNFQFCLKESVQACLPARAVEITDAADRRYIMMHPATQWYRDHVTDPEDLVRDSPIIEVFLEGYPHA